MEKRVLLAVLLSFVVLFLYQAAFVRDPPAKGRPAPVAGKAAPVGSEAGQAARDAGSGPEAATPSTPETAGGAPVATPVPPASAPAEPVVFEPAEREVVIETQEVRAVVSNRGGVITSYRLKKYRDPQGNLLELVPQDVAAGTPRPLTLRVDDRAVNVRLQDALFRLNVEGGTLDASKQAGTLVMEYRDAAGLQARKEVVFQPAAFVITLTATVSEGSRTFNPTIVWGPALASAATATSSYSQKSQAILHRANKVERHSPGDLSNEPVKEAQFMFVGVDDQYFIVAALPKPPARVEYEAVPSTGSAGETAPLVSWSIRVAGGASAVPFFVGPKDFDVLAGLGPEFTKIINFGVFSWLAVPLLRALKWINGFAGNYGWSIILLTVLINLVIFPLRHKSVVSMRKMQEIQPEIKAIQERYAKVKATDPARQKMNTEMMALYRERGVNPASGCVPMLLTLPVLFAFYSLLSQAIEIRGAPFALWIRDLSVHDPLYITPVIMGATQVWQQKMTPSTVDPTQQKMMMLMPVVFTVMFLWAPSGLVLYWLVSNLLAIGQQYLTNRVIGPPPVRAVRPPAERRLKSAGGGKSAGAQ